MSNIEELRKMVNQTRRILVINVIIAILTTLNAIYQFVK